MTDGQPDVFTFRAVAIARTPFREKFGIPRQSGLVEEVTARIELVPPFDRAEAFREIGGFSHVWLLWVAHRAVGDMKSMTVRPPRLGGNRKVGVFASRSPFRPNPVGLSVVRLLEADAGARPPALVVAGADLLDGTPVIDIKPYLPYADAVPDASGGFAQLAPDPVFAVTFSPAAEALLDQRGDGEHLRALVTRLLELDPRPAYREQEAAAYAFRVEDVDVRWRVDGGRIEVTGFDAAGPAEQIDPPAGRKGG
jgi:tRNA-Thr(GGU) m(6)t(6)A37 methyltransferase TsaA